MKSENFRELIEEQERNNSVFKKVKSQRDELLTALFQCQTSCENTSRSAEDRCLQVVETAKSTLESIKGNGVLRLTVYSTED